MYSEEQLVKRAKEAGYTQYTGDELPDNLVELLKKAGAGEYGRHFKNLVFHKGNSKTTKNWVIVFDDGGFYKVGAQTMIWRYDSEFDELIGRARWTDQSLFDGLSEFFQSGQISRDPNYQT